MSYTTTDAHTDLMTRIDEVLESRDIEGAYLLANVFARAGDDEQADYFINLARRWNKEDWAYDEANNN